MLIGIKGNAVPCAFCGEPFQKPHRPRSGEHAWAKWLADYLGGEGEQFTHYVRHPETEEVLKRWTSATLGVVAGKVCEPCNTGWMEASENAARPFLTSMIVGNRRTYYEHGQTVLAAWAVKTALALHLAIPDADPLPEGHYRALAANPERPPEATQVFIAAYEGPFHAHCKPRLFTMETSAGTAADGYVMTFFVRHAVFQVFGYVHEEPIALTKRGTLAHATAQIWPVLGPVEFPPRLILQWGGFRQLAMPPEPEAA